MTPDWQNEIRRLNRLADRIESGERQPASVAKSVRQHARRIEAAVAEALDQEAELRRSRIRGPRLRKTPTTYAVETSRRGPALCEYRSSSTARPFKVPKNVYDALVRVMCKTKKPTKFAEIESGLQHLLGEPVPEYLPRSAIRFWTSCGLVDHCGARFRINRSATEFRSEAKAVWQRASEKPIEVQPNVD